MIFRELIHKKMICLFQHRNISSAQQLYDVTKLRKSVNRAHDSLQPPPQASNPAWWKMRSQPIRENPLASHQSQFEIFPTWKRDDVSNKTDSVTSQIDNVAKKDGNIHEEELQEENENEEKALTLPPLVTSQKNFFSKHKTITSFNYRHPSETPSLGTRCGRRPADWHLRVATHTVGR